MPSSGWRYNSKTIETLLDNEEIYFGEDENYIPNRKIYLKDYLTQIPKGINFYDTQSDVRFLKSENFPFDFPKPKNFLCYLMNMINIHSDDIILDFFSGSATTAHAVMQLNAEDGGRRKFIMVQLPEECAPDSEAAKAGYKNICEIGKERIRRAGEKIKQENAGKDGIENLDVGFRVLKCDTSNMKDVFYAPKDTDQARLDDLIGNIREDRSDLDLLFGCLVEWGLPLSLPYKTEDICGSPVHFYDYAQNPEETTALAACFAANISEEAIREIASRKPLRAVFRDSSFPNAEAKINLGELFKTLAPDTTVRVI